MRSSIDLDQSCVGLSYEVFKGAKVDLRYHDTNTSNFGTLGDARVVGSFSMGF